MHTHINNELKCTLENLGLHECNYIIKAIVVVYDSLIAYIVTNKIN